jgi:hypothetical protein
LLLKDAAGNEYNIDSVIVNARGQPLVLIESKYLRDTKHNRDKGSWICLAHYSLRRRFPTIRKSIAVLAGTWSGSSKAMMQSFDVSLFEVGFTKVAEVLASYDVDIEWDDKQPDKADKAMRALQKWRLLKPEQYTEIGRQLLSDIELLLSESLKETLDMAVPRKVSAVEITVGTNLGESRRYTFESMAAALAFLEQFDEAALLSDDGPAIWDTQAIQEDAEPETPLAEDEADEP